ncbi:MAG: [Clostridia bacterium]|nr:[FeFe] hydrogenase H-cluster maturation GTPase HydF [Clostridia bacterium]
MGLNDQVSAERVHIGFFGLRNAGKSSVVNAVTGQKLSLVSDVKGTTTDPVSKAMELLPLGPVVIIDTPGIDDVGQLGEMRVKRAKQILNKTDVAVLVVDAQKGIQAQDNELIDIFKAKDIPYIVVYNKSDLLDAIPTASGSEIYVSAEKGTNVNELKDIIAGLAKRDPSADKRIVGDIIAKGDVVVLVTPIDSAAPKGRLILPQQQTIRDILDSGATAMVCRETELSGTLAALKDKPKLVITDSQAFGIVNKNTSEDILLTSFSILFARYKGDLAEAVRGAAMLDKLCDGDRVLISEGCTHHRQCGDIGTVKLPAWIKKYTGRDITFDFTSGGEFPEDLSPYSLVVHCGGCMLNEREMKYRIRHSLDSNIPITNYGIAIAQVHGILRRSLSPFPEIQRELDR